MKLNVNSISVNDRKRKLNAEKVDNLAESFALLGQLEPITIAKNGDKYTLLAGWHRLEAARRLGWETIEANVFDGNDLECELVEIDENLMNNDLTVLEQGEHIQRRNEILVAMGQRREAGRYQTFNGVMVTPLKTTEDIAKEVGLSKNSVQKRAQIARDILPEAKELIRDTEIANSTTQLLELARLKPEKQIEIAKSITNGSINIADAFKNINKEKRERMHEEKRTRELPMGKYSVILADPPWRYDNSGFDEAADNQYPTMPTEEICTLPIAALADETTVLFLWATNPLLCEALEVMKAWGFEYKTNMAWIKDAGRGKGWFLKSKHELLLIGTKLNTPHPKIRPDSCFEAARGTVHSKKPDIVYEIIEAMYPGNKIELFARNTRDGWNSWGNEL